jgi:hypothetical protein
MLIGSLSCTRTWSSPSSFVVINPKLLESQSDVELVLLLEKRLKRQVATFSVSNIRGKPCLFDECIECLLNSN